MEFVHDVLKAYHVMEGTQLYTEAMRHANTLFSININALAQVVTVPEEFYLNHFKLFFASYLIDSALDLRTANEWEKPTYLFAGLNICADFQMWLKDKHGQHFLDLYQEYYKLQWQYQVLEREWETPMEFIQNFHSYRKYYYKQIVLLFPILLLSQYGIDDSKTLQIYQAFQLHYSLVLAIDDYYDATFDIVNQTLTPIAAKYYQQNGHLPDTNSDISDELSQAETEIFQIVDEIKELCKKANLKSEIFFENLERFVDFAHEKMR